MQIRAISQPISNTCMRISQAAILQRPTMAEGHHYTSYITQTTQAFQTDFQLQPHVISLVVLVLIVIQHL